MNGRATERERDARLLGYLATKLLSGEPLVVLDDFASALIEPFDRCAASCPPRPRTASRRSGRSVGRDRPVRRRR
jgi:hypothetical protein